MTPEQKSAVLFIHEKGQATAEDIANRTGLNARAVGDCLYELRSAGLITPSTTRHKAVTLTIAGHRAVPQIKRGGGVALPPKVGQAAAPIRNPATLPAQTSATNSASARNGGSNPPVAVAGGLPFDGPLPPPQDVEPRTFTFPESSRDRVSEAGGRVEEKGPSAAAGDAEARRASVVLPGLHPHLEPKVMLDVFPQPTPAPASRPHRDPAHISGLVLDSLKGMAVRCDERLQKSTEDAKAIRRVIDLVKSEDGEAAQ